MKKSLRLVMTLMVLIVTPLFANAGQGRSIYFLLEGGQAWGEALSGPLASAKICLPLVGKLWLQAGYNHYFDPKVWNDPSGIKRSAFMLGLQFKGRERGRRLQWFVHCDGGSFRSNSRWYPDEFTSEFGFALGGGLEKPLSERIGLRCDLRAWSLYSGHVGFLSDEAWIETSLGFFYRL